MLQDKLLKLAKIQQSIVNHIGFSEGYHIVFTGTRVLDILGLISRPMKDWDIVLVSSLKAVRSKLKSVLTGIPELSEDEIEEHGSNDSFLERISLINIDGEFIEFFIEESREFMSVYAGNVHVGISLIPEMFEKKWKFNPDKTRADINLINGKLEEYDTGESRNQNFSRDTTYDHMPFIPESDNELPF